MGMLTKEVAKGWHLLLPIDLLSEIPSLVVGPMGLSNNSQSMRTETLPTKHRMMHNNQSFAYDLETIKLMNLRVLTDFLSRCIYGFAVRRMAHNIIVTQTMHTTTPNLENEITNHPIDART